MFVAAEMSRLPEGVPHERMRGRMQQKMAHIFDGQVAREGNSADILEGENEFVVRRLSNLIGRET